MTLRIDKRRALSMLRKAVEAEGKDKTVDACTYWTRDADTNEKVPNCIVGHALAQAGSLDLIRIGQNSDIFTSVVLDLNDRPGVQISPNASTIFREAQKIQDNYSLKNDPSATWGRALAVAEEVAANLR